MTTAVDSNYSIGPVVDHLTRGGIVFTVDLDGGVDGDPAVIVRRALATFYVEPADPDDSAEYGAPLFAVYRYNSGDDRASGIDEQSVEFVLAADLVSAVTVPVVTVLVHLNYQVVAASTDEAEKMVRGYLRAHKIDDDLVSDVEAV